MSAALRDLPDPLDPSPTMATSSPDDLLAKMADEAIDRLMAEADKGGGPAAPLVPMDAVAEVPTPTAESPTADGPVHATVPVADATAPAVVVPSADAAPVALSESLTPPASPSAGEAPVPPAPAADVRALLHDDHAPADRPSPLLWPLWLLNLPFAGMSDNARRVFGLLGVVTLVPAAAAIAYVVWLKRH